MKLKETFAINEMLDMFVAVAVGQSATRFQGMITMDNETTKRMFELLQEEKSLDEIVEIMLDEYDVDEPRLREQLNRFIDMLRAENLIEE